MAMIDPFSLSVDNSERGMKIYSNNLKYGGLLNCRDNRFDWTDNSES